MLVPRAGERADCLALEGVRDFIPVAVECSVRTSNKHLALWGEVQARDLHQGDNCREMEVKAQEWKKWPREKL